MALVIESTLWQINLVARVVFFSVRRNRMGVCRRFYRMLLRGFPSNPKTGGMYLMENLQLLVPIAVAMAMDF